MTMHDKNIPTRSLFDNMLILIKSDINECVRGIDGNPVCTAGKCVNLLGGYTCEYTNHRPLVIGKS